MKQFMCGLVVGLAVVAPASATSYFGMTPNVASPFVIAGSVSADGVPIGGSGFTVNHNELGRYEIHFRNNRVRSCATMVASPVPSAYHLTANTAQKQCSQKFDIDTGYFNQQERRGINMDTAFSFVVVQQ